MHLLDCNLSAPIVRYSIAVNFAATENSSNKFPPHVDSTKKEKGGEEQPPKTSDATHNFSADVDSEAW